MEANPGKKASVVESPSQKLSDLTDVSGLGNSSFSWFSKDCHLLLQCGQDKALLLSIKNISVPLGVVLLDAVYRTLAGDIRCVPQMWVNAPTHRQYMQSSSSRLSQQGELPFISRKLQGHYMCQKYPYTPLRAAKAGLEADSASSTI